MSYLSRYITKYYWYLTNDKIYLATNLTTDYWLTKMFKVFLNKYNHLINI